MKRSFLLLALLFLCVSVPLRAQSIITYHGEADMAYSAGVGQLSVDRYNIHTIHGIMVDDNCSVGIGVGIDCYTAMNQISVAVPVYLGIKGYLPISDIMSAFIGLDCGIGIGASEYAKGYKGLYLSPSLGMKIGHLKLQIGYNVQRISENISGVNLGAIQAKLGVMF